MDARSIIDFANQHSVCWLATSTRDVPHVRGMWLWFADEQGLVFHTGSTKSLAEELEQNHRVEVAFYDPGDGQGSGRMLRIAGEAAIQDDAMLRERLVAERPWLRTELAKTQGVSLVIFRVKKCVAHFWTMPDNLHERDLPRVQFG